MHDKQKHSVQKSAVNSPAKTNGGPAPAPEATCPLAREPAAAAVAVGTPSNNVDTSESRHFSSSANSSVVPAVSAASPVAKGSRRQRKQAAENARRSESAASQVQRERQAHVEAMSKLRTEFDRVPTFCDCERDGEWWIEDNVRVDASGYYVCRQCRHTFKFDHATWYEMVVEAIENVAQRAELERESSDEGAAEHVSMSKRAPGPLKDIDEYSADPSPTEEEILEMLAPEYYALEDHFE